MSIAYWLLIALLFLVVLSGFFSSSETAMMALNRYRLRYLVKKKHPGAARVLRLLARPDRLLGVILIGNTCVNILISVLATVLAVRLWGDAAVWFMTVAVTFVILVFSEVAPKTLAAMYPERLALLVALPLQYLLKTVYPVVWFVNTVANLFLSLCGIKIRRAIEDALSHEELRTVVHEASTKLSSGYQDMMLGVLDLGNVLVDDIAVPRHDIVGIDLNAPWELILQQLATSEHTRLPIFKDTIDHVKGILHLRRALNLLAKQALNQHSLQSIADRVHFVPEGTPLNVQLSNFRKEKTRLALVVDEYGDIQGLITLEDILEEIVGEFTTDLAEHRHIVRFQKDGSYLLDGTMNVRDVNRVLNWKLPSEGAKTMSGLIIDYLEMIPERLLGLSISGYPMEIVSIKNNVIKTIKIWPMRAQRALHVED